MEVGSLIGILATGAALLVGGVFVFWSIGVALNNLAGNNNAFMNRAWRFLFGE